MPEHVSALVCPPRIAVKNFSHVVTCLTLRNGDKAERSTNLPTIPYNSRIQAVGRRPIGCRALRHTERECALLGALGLLEAEAVQRAVVGPEIDATVRDGEA